MEKRIIALFLIAIFIIVTSIHVFAAPSDAPLVTLTEQENAYFSQLKTLRVLTAPGVHPYAYENTGISLDILKRLCEFAGIALEVIEAESYVDALTRLENKEAELSAIKISLCGDEERILPYLYAPLQMVHYNQISPSEQISLSLARLQGVDFSNDKKYFADTTLYRVKNEGRNCFHVIYQTEESDLPSMGVTK